ncbi:MAG: cellulase family glycosylhydrolase [Gallionella sp.]
MPNKTIRGPDGKRFIVNGVTAWFGLLMDTNTVSGYKYPKYGVAGKGPGTGISEPTYYARQSYRTAAWRATEYRAMKQVGINFLRLAVELSTMNSSVSYVDPVDGLTYPSDEVMMDTLVDECEDYGFVIQIIPGNDYDSIADTVVLLKWLAGKYWNREHVWIATKNEPNAFGPNVAYKSDATFWSNEHVQYVAALREDIPGQAAGTKYRNPICLCPPPHNGTIWITALNLVYTKLTTVATFTGEDNLVINVHYYPLSNTTTSFRTSELATIQTAWAQYLNSLAIISNESGHNGQAFGNRLDPNLDASVPSVNLTYWANNQLKMKDFFGWAKQLSEETSFSGLAAQDWGMYVLQFQGTTENQHDNNSQRRYTSSGDFIEWSTSGIIWRDYYLSPPVKEPFVMLRTKAELQAMTGYIPMVALCSDSSGANNPELVVYKDVTLGWRLVSTGAAI